jgi:hypothetical protein
VAFHLEENLTDSLAVKKPSARVTFPVELETSGSAIVYQLWARTVLIKAAYSSYLLLVSFALLENNFLRSTKNQDADHTSSTV